MRSSWTCALANSAVTSTGRTVRAIVQRTAPAGRGYARAAIEYCDRAHFQAVVDEYLFVGKNVLQRNTQGEMAEHIARVLGVGTGSPNINLTTDTGRIRSEQLARRSHFALAFGEDVKADQGSPLEQSGPSRKTAVREAFNSPFWPFVLSTTSVGQEGLDFHLFCRDIVHWNLPSNPVDLEQRRGPNQPARRAGDSSRHRPRMAAQATCAGIVRSPSELLGACVRCGF